MLKMKTLIAIAMTCMAIIQTSADEIHLAVQNGELTQIKMLLEQDKNLLNAKDDHGMAPLHIAIDIGNNDVIRYLIDQGADLSLKDDIYGATPLYYATVKGNTEIAELLIEKNRTVLEAKDHRQKTSLLAACEHGHPQMVELLLNYGADINARDILGQTPLMSACASWNMEVVKLLVDKGVNINDITRYQDREYTVLTIAAMYRFREMVDYLIDLKAEIPTSVLELTLQYAVRGDHSRLFDYVQEKGLNLVNENKDKHQELIYMASVAGSTDIFSQLVELGFDPLKPDQYGWTSLHHAASYGKKEMIQFLLNKGVALNTRSTRGETAYNIADFLGREEIINYLQKVGADTSGVQFPVITGKYMGQKPPADSPKMFMPGIVSGPYRAHGTVVFSPDGTEAYWSDMIPASQGGLEMKMINNQWTFPAKSIMWKDPSISPNGNRLIYISKESIDENDPGGKENYWYMDRTSTGWTKPKPVDRIINKINIHWQCSMDTKGNLYFSEFEDKMYISELKNGEYQEPINLKIHFDNPSLNGHSPFIDPNGDYLVFADDGRLYVSFKKEDDTWTDRADLGDKINTGTGCGAPRVTYDGKYLFFQSTSGEDRPWGIYWVSSDVIYRLQKVVQ